MVTTSRAFYSAAIFGGACVLGLATSFLVTDSGYTAPVLNQVLSGAQALPAKGSGCPSIRIGFNFRVRYISHFPVTGGKELRIRVKPLDRVDAQQNIDAPRETVRAPRLPGVDIRSIEFEVNGSGPTLVINFADQVAYSVRQGSDFSSILVMIAGQNASQECRASLADIPVKPGAIKTVDTAQDTETTAGVPGMPDGRRVEIADVPQDNPQDIPIADPGMPDDMTPAPVDVTEKEQGIDVPIAEPEIQSDLEVITAGEPESLDTLVKTDIPSETVKPTPESETSNEGKTDKLIGEARTAIAKKNYRSAIQKLTKLISLPPHKHSAQAQELLGVVRERNGQFAHAKAEYEIYLKKYSKEEGVGRVRQRLAAISTAESELPGKLRKAGSKAAEGEPQIATADQPRTLRKARTEPLATPETNATDETQVAIDVPGDVGQSQENQTKARTTRLARAELGENTEDPAAFKTEFSGSFSEFYFRNQEFTRLKEFESRRTTKDDDIFQNSLQSSLDLIGSAENNILRFKSRFSGGHEADFTEGVEHDYRVSALYGEVEVKELGAEARIGRQTRNSGGILGRFDGGLLSWLANEMVKLNFVVGSPVDSSRDEPFIHDRLFYGASVDFEEFYKGWDLTVFAIEQRADSLIDRRAIGVEVLYVDQQSSFFGTIDYDVNFNRINAAVLSGSYTFSDNSTVSASADFLYSPSLSLSNALQGQTASTLDGLRNSFSVSEIKELALDRSTETKSLNLAYSKPLNEMWQVTVDGTLFNTSGSPASGGVAAVESVGTEYFTSAQLVGTGVFTENDIVSATTRYANTSSSDLYLMDVYDRFPINKELRLRPRLRAGYRDLKRTNGREIFANPSITADYRYSRSTSFELELGGRWADQKTSTTREKSTELFVIAGFRFEF